MSLFDTAHEMEKHPLSHNPLLTPFNRFRNSRRSDNYEDDLEAFSDGLKKRAL